MADRGQTSLNVRCKLISAFILVKFDCIGKNSGNLNVPFEDNRGVEYWASWKTNFLGYDVASLDTQRGVERTENMLVDHMTARC